MVIASKNIKRVRQILNSKFSIRSFFTEIRADNSNSVGWLCFYKFLGYPNSKSVATGAYYACVSRSLVLQSDLVLHNTGKLFRV